MKQLEAEQEIAKQKDEVQKLAEQNEAQELARKQDATEYDRMVKVAAAAAVEADRRELSSKKPEELEDILLEAAPEVRDEATGLMGRFKNGETLTEDEIQKLPVDHQATVRAYNTKIEKIRKYNVGAQQRIDEDRRLVATGEKTDADIDVLEKDRRKIINKQLKEALEGYENVDIEATKMKLGLTSASGGSKHKRRTSSRRTSKKQTKKPITKKKPRTKKKPKTKKKLRTKNK